MKIVSAVVDADPCRGSPAAEQLESLGALIEDYEANKMALMMLDRESCVTLSRSDLSAFSEALSGEFKPNSALKEALSAAKELVRRG